MVAMVISHVTGWCYVRHAGNLENRQCAMNIGAVHAGTDYFQGLMDDVSSAL